MARVQGLPTMARRSGTKNIRDVPTIASNRELKMPLPFFELCNEFCALASISPIEPMTSADGSAVLTLDLDHIEVSLFQVGADPERVYRRVIFGPMEPDDDAARWNELLEVNFMMFGTGTPAFCS